VGFTGGLLVSAAITSCEGLIRDDKVVVMFSALAISLLLLVNTARMVAHEPVLRLSAALTATAQTQRGTHHTKVIGRPGCHRGRWWAAGQNLAWGFWTPEEAFDAWMKSPEHRANILEPIYRRTGIARVVIKGGIPVWVEDFCAP
jgi:hypothetical protein